MGKIKVLISTKNLKKLALLYSNPTKLDSFIENNEAFLSFLFDESTTNTCARTMIGYIMFNGLLLEKDEVGSLKWFICEKTGEPNDYIAQFFVGLVCDNCIDKIEPTISNFGLALLYEGQSCNNTSLDIDSFRYVLRCFKLAAKNGSIQAKIELKKMNKNQIKYLKN